MMNQNTTCSPLYRWTFWLADELPGPSQGDAAELIESLGFDPWSFPSLELVSEARWSKVFLSQFEVTGPQEKLEALRLAYERHTSCVTPAPRAISGTSAFQELG